MLRALAPSARVVANRVFVVDGPLASSAGITAGIDLALHLIAEECGEALAATVAEDMVVYSGARRPTRSSSPFLVHRRHLHAAVHRVQDAILAVLRSDWDMARARLGRATPPSAICCDSSSITSGFRRFTICAPSGSSGPASPSNAGRASPAPRESAGFRSDLRLRRAWGRQWGGSPRDLTVRATAAV